MQRARGEKFVASVVAAGFAFFAAFPIVWAFITSFRFDIDIVTHHDYGGTGTSTIKGLGVEGAPWRIRTARGIMRITGTADKPLWLTETGWRTDQVTQTQQADYYEQVLDGLTANPALLDKVFFYEMADDPRFPNQWGIVQADLTPKEAYFRYQEYIATHAAAPVAWPIP